jgi:Fe-S-cluster-containing dehydrogenase component
VRLKSELCIGCRNCVEACPYGAVLWDAEVDKPEICVHCGYCASYCPYDVLALEEVTLPDLQPAGGAHVGQ